MIKSLPHDSHRYRSAPLRGGDHVRSQRLWWIDALADFLLDEMHSQGKLLSGEFAYLPRVCQSPAGTRCTLSTLTK